MLDYNKDGYVDMNDWNIVLFEYGNPYLDQIKKLIEDHRIKADDLLYTM